MKLQDRVKLAWGKARRVVLIALFKRTVDQNINRRRGSCNRSGACCKLLIKCPAFDDSDGSPRCLVYNDRPGVCGLFPIDERDLAERNLVEPNVKCGFHFIEKRLASSGDNGNGKSGAHRQKPLKYPWENGKRGMGMSFISGTVAIFQMGVKRGTLLSGGNGNGNGKAVHKDK